MMEGVLASTESSWIIREAQEGLTVTGQAMVNLQ
jgi:hypothetical protein